ncbi:MAG: hypothetical protein HY706_15730 [Candidatus Hydrogenedentes bacterium]|nr:hypothetical protein [Candidatus Hydrogenedentota bacterium]
MYVLGTNTLRRATLTIDGPRLTYWFWRFTKELFVVDVDRLIILRAPDGHVSGLKLFRGRKVFALGRFEEMDRVIELIRENLPTNAQIEEKRTRLGPIGQIIVNATVISIFLSLILMLFEYLHDLI